MSRLAIGLARLVVEFHIIMFKTISFLNKKVPIHPEGVNDPLAETHQPTPSGLRGPWCLTRLDTCGVCAEAGGRATQDPQLPAQGVRAAGVQRVDGGDGHRARGGEAGG